MLSVAFSPSSFLNANLLQQFWNGGYPQSILNCVIWVCISPKWSASLCKLTANYRFFYFCYTTGVTKLVPVLQMTLNSLLHLLIVTVADVMTIKTVSHYQPSYRINLTVFQNNMECQTISVQLLSFIVSVQHRAL